jgi:putative pyruvate formate lyase activating enzyme
MAFDNEIYRQCTLCPRQCGAGRLGSRAGGAYCGETAELRIAAASIHRGEEPPITGRGGSGTVFVSGCNLGCVFCQNYQISRKGMGKKVSREEFVRICLKLQDRGAENINIVTGSHAVPAIVEGIQRARNEGLVIPLLWNSSAYESIKALELLEDTVDVYLPDLKTLDTGVSCRFFNASDYPEYAEKAILRMMELKKLRYKQSAGGQGELSNNDPPMHDPYGETGEVLVSGVVIRHLYLPDYPQSTRSVLRWFAENAQGRALLSLMTQYTPPAYAKTSSVSIPNRFLNEQEYETLLEWLDEFDINDGFCQELVTGNDWLPDFEQVNPFSSNLSIPVWYWKEGFV